MHFCSYYLPIVLTKETIALIISCQICWNKTLMDFALSQFARIKNLMYSVLSQFARMKNLSIAASKNLSFELIQKCAPLAPSPSLPLGFSAAHIVLYLCDCKSHTLRTRSHTHTHRDCYSHLKLLRVGGLRASRLDSSTSGTLTRAVSAIAFVPFEFESNDWPGRCTANAKYSQL